MRKRIFYFLSGLMLLTINSCNFLEVDPIGRTSLPVLFSDMEGIRAALPGTYSAVYKYYDSEFYLYPEVAGNMVHLNTVSEDAAMVTQYNFNSSPEEEVAAVGYIWRFIYEALANINNIIYYQPELLVKYPGNETELNRIMAEALFLRALGHFDLVRVYAQPYNYTSDASHPGIPIVLTTPGAHDNLSRNTVAQVYAQIIADLEQSLIYFEGTSPRKDYYASPDAVHALLSRVYLYMEKWEETINHASAVIDNIPLSYGENYLAMYNELQPGHENIFRLNGTLKSSKLSNFYSPASPVAIPSDTLISLFNDSTDIRLRLLTNDNGQPVNRKYLITANVSEENKHTDPFVLRASEMYLNRAEAYLNQNLLQEAASDIKTLIARNLRKDESEVFVDVSDLNGLAKTIEAERVKELSFEGHQLWDITRRKQDLIRSSSTNSSVKQLNYPNNLFILPIPQKEIDTNTNIQQNP